MKQVVINSRKISLVKGDITDLDTDAIVNAANEHLLLGGGVAGAIRVKGGPAIQQECNRIGKIFVGGAVITKAGKLKAKYVIHAVGPRMGEGDEERKLGDATRNSLELMDTHGLKSIAFPAISTGIFGYPVRDCARIMITTVREYLAYHANSSIDDVQFCLYDDATYHVFENVLED
nr:macro domain-containing protein [Candidatus Sigynarchaeota archaeon]